MRKISKTFKINRIREVYVPDKADKKIHSDINDEIRKKYNILMTDRDTIIRSLISILTQGDYNRSIVCNIDFTIIRSDIENFYPSIKKHKLFQKISQSNILRKESIDILKPLFFNKRIKGLPLGFSFSSSLSEIYLEDFDEQIYYEFNPVYYFRYVDDIIIIIYYDKNIESSVFESKLKKIAENNGLNINDKEDKTDIVNWIKNRNETFNFLGYSFMKEKNKLLIDISNAKYKKVTQRIRGYFYDYSHSNKDNKSFWRLYYRLKNRLYGITSDTEKNLKFGLGYSYKYINTDGQLIQMIELISYHIRKEQFSSYKRNTLFSLIKFDKSIFEILKRRKNYNRLTHDQLNEICRRLDINYSPYSSKNFKVRNFFKSLK